MKKIKFRFPADMNAKHFAFVAPGATIEMPEGLILTDRDCDIDTIRLVYPGLYAFTSRVARDKFVRVINAGEEQELAYKLSRD